ncbi:MAG: cell division protein ZapD [Sulfuriferula sp.]
MSELEHYRLDKPHNRVIHYEYPLNERVRTLLRLEGLFQKALYFIALDEPLPHQTALFAIFDIIEVAARADLKSDLLQELERQRQSLELLRHNRAIDTAKLDEVLDEINLCLRSVHSLAGRLDQPIKEHEWLSNVKQRANIPGGVSGFDLPVFYHWLHIAGSQRRDHLTAWLAPMLPIYRGLSIVLKLLRESGQQQPTIAIKGCYQQMLAGRNAQLLKISLDHSVPYVPETSANKYALSVRFLCFTEAPPRTCTEDIEFGLGFCNL